MKENMRKYCLLISLLIFTIDGFTQKRSSSFQSGTFVCRINKYIIFQESEGESRYSLKALCFQTKEKIILDNDLLKTDCIKLSDTLIAYIKGKNVIQWNSFLAKKSSYLKSEKDWDIIGLGIDQNKKNILMIQINYSKNELLIKILNTENKESIFQQKIKLNDAELEGLSSNIAEVANCFIFLIQDKLYSIDLANPILKLISNKSDTYAINKSGVVYYKFVTDESTEGYFLQLSNWQTNKIDNLLNDKIYDCERSFLLTARINDQFVPIYIICGSPFIFTENRWITPSSVTVYSDNIIVIEIPLINNKIKEFSFFWSLKNG